MAAIVVAGACNIETTLRVDDFPFASYKIGEAGAAQGFLDARRLDALYGRTLND